MQKLRELNLSNKIFKLYLIIFIVFLILSLLKYIGYEYAIILLPLFLIIMFSVYVIPFLFLLIIFDKILQKQNLSNIKFVLLLIISIILFSYSYNLIIHAYDNFMNLS